MLPLLAGCLLPTRDKTSFGNDIQGCALVASAAW
jgi:hypothetical protein